MPRMQSHQIGGVTSELYDRAVSRVQRSPRLRKFERIILGDWSEGDDHLRWVIRATVKEIEAWASEIQKGDK